MIAKKGCFMVVTGGEGAGKSTQAKRAEKEFPDRVVYTREPGGTPLAEELRKNFLSAEVQSTDPSVRMLLAFAMRADHLQRTIRPALLAGKLVICDRFDSDTFAYQLRAEGGQQHEDLFWILREKVLGETKPDLYVHFDIEPLEGLKRKLDASVADKNVYDIKPASFHRDVHEGLKEFMKKAELSVRVDASLDKEKVWESFKEIVEGQLRLLGH